MSTVPQDPTKFGYRADAEVKLSGQEFTILQHLAQKAIGNGVTETFIQAYEWILIETGEPVEKPTQKQIQDGKVQRIPSKAKTLQNKQISYDANLHPEIFDGNEVIFRVHLRNIESDVAVPVSTLEKEYHERQAKEAEKGKMTVIGADESITDVEAIEVKAEEVKE